MFLVTMMLGVKNGQVKPDDARNVVKLAAQVNESFYTELKNRQLDIFAEQTTTPLGELQIGHHS